MKAYIKGLDEIEKFKKYVLTGLVIRHPATVKLNSTSNL